MAAKLITMKKAIGHVLLFSLMLLIICQVHSLRSPFYVTGKFKKTEVNAGQWSTIETKNKVTRICSKTSKLKILPQLHKIIFVKCN